MVQAPNPQEQNTLEQIMTLALTSGVGPRIYRTLLKHFGNVERVLQASLQELEMVAGIGGKLSRRIALAANNINVAEELTICRQHQIDVTTPTAAEFPHLLNQIEDPPPLLFQLGEVSADDSLSVAIVGSRHATRYGLTQAHRLAASLAQAGFTIVSGLARGIDAAAHRGALSVGGRTLAVLGSGVLNIYPPEHAGLANDITKHGALISESPPRRQPFSGAFPQRNRLISGLSLGVVVIEAAERSGALITARHANEQGRDVFAVPGRIDSNLSRGCHRLIRDGAKLVQTVDDIIEELGPLHEVAACTNGNDIHHPAELQLNELEMSILQCIQREPTSIDQVVHESGRPAHHVLSTISILEMKRLIHRVSGQYVARI